MKFALFLLMLVCARAAHWTTTVAPQERESMIQRWRATNPTGSVNSFSGRSMIPTLIPGDMLLQDAYVGQRCKKEILLADEGDGRRMTEHYCYDETDTHVFLTGLNNRRSDGWYSKDRVLAVLVGVIRVDQ